MQTSGQIGAMLFHILAKCPKMCLFLSFVMHTFAAYVVVVVTAVLYEDLSKIENPFTRTIQPLSYSHLPYAFIMLDVACD